MIVHPTPLSLTVYIDQCDSTITTDIKENAVLLSLVSPLLPTPNPVTVHPYDTTVSGQ